MNLTTKEISNSQVPFGQAGNLISSPKVFPKQSLEQIADTEISFCNISFSDFNVSFRFEIVDIIGDEFSSQIVFKLESEDNFFVYLKMNGHWELNEEYEFQPDNIDWNFEEKENNPTSAFILETLKTILCLSEKIKVEIPNINYHFETSIPLPLNNISEIMQTRQIAYRLMVIEKAFQVSLPFPREFIAGEELENIAFCYHAIVDRKFEWAVESFTLFPPAIEENLKYLPSENTSYHLTFPTLNEIRFIFNQELFFGNFLIYIEKTMLENYEEVKEKFDKLDGQPVGMTVKSLNGKIKYISLNAPKLPKNAWNKKTRKLIDLDEKFNTEFLEKYFNLAASTLKGLSEEQKKSITERPKLSINFD